MVGINDCGVAEAVTVSVWFSPPELMPVRNTVRAPESSAIVRLANPAFSGGSCQTGAFVLDHQNLVQFYEFYEDLAGMMEYVQSEREKSQTPAPPG